MCGRARLESDYSELKIQFKIPDDSPSINYPPNWNLAPTQRSPIVRLEEGRRMAEMAKWGLLPYWAKDEKIAYSTINARAETLTEKPAFRDAWRKARRCIVPVDSFYEWKVLGPKEKQPYAIGFPDRRIMPLAGLYETWKSKESGEVIRSFTIIVAGPNDFMAGIHDRMPVIVPEEAWPIWLGEREASSDQLRDLMVPYAGQLRAWPVSKDVGNVKNTGPQLIEPVGPDFVLETAATDGLPAPETEQSGAP
jgi:putative SOS response-associated peptidase YedK